MSTVQSQAIVVSFDAASLTGNLHLLDAEGDPIPKSILFSYDAGVYPTLSVHSDIDFGGLTERNGQRLRLPRPGDTLVLQHKQEWIQWAEPQYNTIVERWTYHKLWETDQQNLDSRPMAWRLVRRLCENYVHQDEPGGLESVEGRHISGTVIKHGDAVLLSTALSWDGEHFSLHIWNEPTARTDEWYHYALELFLPEEERWTEVKMIVPVGYADDDVTDEEL